MESVSSNDDVESVHSDNWLVQEVSDVEEVNHVPEPDVDDEQDLLCTVCLLQPRQQVVLVPCGHASFCINCVNELRQRVQSCPICRAEINAAVAHFESVCQL